MARRTAEPQEPTDDIEINMPEGAGFANVPPPVIGANELARAMSGQPTEFVGPIAMPEEAVRRADPLHVEPSHARPGRRRPIADIVDAFLADIAAHPDAHLLGSTVCGQADEAEAQCFPDAPVRSLRVDRIAIIRRTTQEIAPAPSSSERQRWQDQVIAGHVADMRVQQEAKAESWSRNKKPAVDPDMIAAVTAAVVAAMKAQTPQAATA